MKLQELDYVVSGLFWLVGFLLLLHLSLIGVVPILVALHIY